jgi:hypothetical protein
MTTPKKLGIWLDHTTAHIMELKNNSISSKTIESLSEKGEKQTFGQDETLEQNTEQDQLADLFTRLSVVIKDYSDVLLFGPTNAKTELYNFLKTDKQFKNSKIDVATTDYITENQMQAFVKEYFEKN